MRKPTIGLRLRVWIIRPNGKKKLVRNRWARSFVQQWIDILYSHFRNTTSGFNVRRTNNVTAGNYYPHTIDTTAPTGTYENSDSMGIVVGSGEGLVDVSDYKLQTQIMHGTTAGTLFHCKCVAGGAVEESTRKMFDFNRTFMNVSGYDVLVREVGVYAREINSNYYYCFVRDVVGPIVVPSMGGIAVNYGFELSL